MLLLASGGSFANLAATAEEEVITMGKSVIKDETTAYIEAAQELRELIRDAHAAAKDLKVERNAYRTARAEFQTTPLLERFLDELAAAEITKWSERVVTHLNELEQAVYNRFDAITLMLLGEDPQSIAEGRISIVDLVAKYVQAQKLPFYADLHLRTSRQEDIPEDLVVVPVIIDKSVPPGAFDIVQPLRDRPTQIHRIRGGPDHAADITRALVALDAIWTEKRDEMESQLIAFRRSMKATEGPSSSEPDPSV